MEFSYDEHCGDCGAYLPPARRYQLDDDGIVCRPCYLAEEADKEAK